VLAGTDAALESRRESVLEDRMSFLSLVSRNLFRQRMRSVLTVVGISVGITIVVALGSITGGVRQTVGGWLRLGDSDFVVARKGSADFSFSTVSEDEWRQLEGMDGVERAMGALVRVTRHGSNPYFILIGVRPSNLAQAPPELVSGRLPRQGSTDEVILGSRAAAGDDAAPGSAVTIDEERFLVVGVYRSDDVMTDSGAYAPLETVREIARTPGVVTGVWVKASPGTDAAALASTVEERFPTLVAVSGVNDFGKVDQGIAIMDALNLAVSTLAVVLGAIAVMNTMIMAVFERTREFGILRAVGWRGSRIMRLVLTEALLLCLVAAVVGTALGVLATRGVMLIEAVQGFLEPTYTLDVFLRAVVIAFAVGLVGAVYPAYRAVRLSPMEALRHE
jgi:putative ABC transport system permease protein